MKNIKSMLMVSLLVCGQGLVASENSLTSVITDGAKKLLVVEAAAAGLGIGIFAANISTPNPFTDSEPELLLLSALKEVQPLPVVGVTGTVSYRLLENMNLSESVGKQGEAGILAAAATAGCVGLVLIGGHAAVGPVVDLNQSVGACAALTTAFIAATGLERWVNSK